MVSRPAISAASGVLSIPSPLNPKESRYPGIKPQSEVTIAPTNCPKIETVGAFSINSAGYPWAKTPKRLGQAFEIGVAVVFIAITLDRYSQALVLKEPERTKEGAFWIRNPYLFKVLFG